MFRFVLVLFLTALSFLPGSNGQTIFGSSVVCVGATVTWSGTPAGGVWNSSDTAIVKIDSVTGITTGISAGVVSIIYHSSLGDVSENIQVYPLPDAGKLVGDSILCIGDTLMLYDITFKGSLGFPESVFPSIARIFFIGTDTMPGHTDISMNIVALTPGVDTISLGVSNFCGVAYAKKTLFVYSSNLTTVSGNDSVCVGQTDTLTPSIPGGVWGVVSGFLPLSPSGVALGLLAGTYNITYVVNNLCGIDTAIFALYVLDSASCSKAGILNTESRPFTFTTFPNPTHGDFTISSPCFEYSDAHIIIADIAGNKVLELDAGLRTDIDIKSHLSPGVYFVVATDGLSRYISSLVVE